MNIKTLIFFLLILPALFFASKAYAIEPSADTSANFATINAEQQQDHRIEILKKYLEHMESPLALYAQDFVVQADAYNLPWNLVAAISGTESTLGKAVP